MASTPGQRARIARERMLGDPGSPSGPAWLRFLDAGHRADLLLLDGDSTTNITDPLSIRAIWRRGVQNGCFSQVPQPAELSPM